MGTAREHTNCVNLWWFENKDGGALPSVLCEVDGVVIDIAHLDATKCKHYAAPEGSPRETTEWFDRNFKAFKENSRESEEEDVRKRLYKNDDGSHRYLRPEYHELCKSYEHD